MAAQPVEYPGKLFYRRSLTMLAVIACVISVQAAAADLTGQASVIDGDTIEIHGTHVRIWGIDAPEGSQLCRGGDGLPYRCGAQAANALADWIGRRVVSCSKAGPDSYGRTVAMCSVDGDDLGAWMISQGYALDWPHYSRGRYSTQQREAVAAGRGIHVGIFVNPWDYRRCVKGGGRIAECSTFGKQ